MAGAAPRDTCLIFGGRRRISSRRRLPYSEGPEVHPGRAPGRDATMRGDARPAPARLMCCRTGAVVAPPTHLAGPTMTRAALVRAAGMRSKSSRVSSWRRRGDGAHRSSANTLAGPTMTRAALVRVASMRSKSSRVSSWRALGAGRKTARGGTICLDAIFVRLRAELGAGRVFAGPTGFVGAWLRLTGGVRRRTCSRR